MSKLININKGWFFSKEATAAPTEMPISWEKVDLPHTWNGTDGQDGGNDYYRGICYYAKELELEPIADTERVYLEFCGTNSSAEVFINGKSVGKHDGGYSTWRVDITGEVQEKLVIALAVDNRPNDRVYPQMADFTFYGGIYRDVNVHIVPNLHFDMDHHGSQAAKVTPKVEGTDAEVEIEAFITGLNSDSNQGNKRLQICLYDMDAQGNKILLNETSKNLEECGYEEKWDSKKNDASNEAVRVKEKFVIHQVRLWNGRKDPHLYRVQINLIENENVLDSRTVKFGCRTFQIDPQKGFLLNGEAYPLRGVSRHQDRPEIGNALLPEHHKEDMDFICEMGANTIRLAHYQHDQYFYDLCDERGMVVWAEIPYISKHMKNGTENTMQQMKELILQNYNHPSIVVWGISNEITMHGASDASMIENHNMLNDLVHQMDSTRLTTEAVVTMCGIEEEYVHIPDVVSYNHYFGWYGGTTDMYGPWFDKFHEKYPNTAIGLSEYGCEALNWHTSTPEQGDYTEEYQAHYHEELIRQIKDRPYLWATHVWNMFDFAADARAEGGENGMNHKGLMTFDRKYKKDAFYAYKAWLSKEPFVHICGKRYTKRAEAVTKVTVYSNLPEVELFANGKSLGVQKKKDVPFFYFDVPNEGETKLEAAAGSYTDESVLQKVEVFPEEYRMKEEGAVINWFDITTPEGYFSINSSIGDIMKTFRGKLVLARVMLKMKKKKEAAHKNAPEKKESSAAGFEMSKEMMELAKGFSVKRGLAMVDKTMTKEEYIKLNQSLNKIRKPR